MRFYKKPKKKAVKPKITLAIGRIYLVRGYHTGNFRAKCCDSLLRSAKFKVTDRMQSTLAIDDELEVPFVHAEFLPAIVEDVKKVIEKRNEARV